MFQAEQDRLCSERIYKHNDTTRKENGMNKITHLSRLLHLIQLKAEYSINGFKKFSSVHFFSRSLPAFA